MYDLVGNIEDRFSRDAAHIIYTYHPTKLQALICSEFYYKNSAEVDIAPAFGEITTACNVGQAKKGHGACLKSG